MKKLFFVAALAGTMLSGAALAGQAAPADQGTPGGRGHGMMMRADTNGDGTISRAEFTAQSEARFVRMDKNGDGFITADEIGGKGGNGPGGGLMAADTDHDGKISRAEFIAQSTERFAKLDANGDGQISGDEMKAVMERVREGGGMMGGRHGRGGQADGAMMPPPPPGAEGGPMGGHHGHRGAHSRLERLDTNHDGKISRDEMRADADRHFDKLDTNHDGFIDQAETDAARAKMKDRMGKMRMHRGMPPGDMPPPPPAPPGQ
jgi:Ca2+-binding EF-hand superfamily protein